MTPSNLVEIDLLTMVFPTSISFKGSCSFFLSFSSRNSVLDWLATRPFDAMKVRTLTASSFSLDLISSLSFPLIPVVVSSANRQYNYPQPEGSNNHHIHTGVQTATHTTGQRLPRTVSLPPKVTDT